MIRAKDFVWETLDGQTYGYVTVGTEDYDLNITERVEHSMWNRATNVRSWRLARTFDNHEIASGHADGLRAAKADAIAALNAHLATTSVVQS